MKTYEVNFKVDAWYVVKVEAEDEDEARQKAEDMLDNVLDEEFHESLVGVDEVSYGFTEEV